MKTSIVYVGFGSSEGIKEDIFFKYGLDICCEFNVLDVSRLRFIARAAFDCSDGIIFVYSLKSWSDIQKVMLMEFERSSIFIEEDKPYVLAKGFKRLRSGVFFDFVYNKPVLFIAHDIKENVDLEEELKPFSTNVRIVKVFDRDMSRDKYCIYSDEVESILLVPEPELKNYDFAYTVIGESAEKSLFDILNGKGDIKIVTVESCTAGLVAARIANVSGVSKFLEGGVITYSNDMKINIVKVNPNILHKVGAVSEEVAYRMAVGALTLASADYSVSVTGIAGPTGATKTKPVGLVWFGFASRKRVVTRKMVFSGNRRIVRDKSARFAILMLRSFILEG